MIRSILIIGGLEITDTVRHFVTHGHTSTTQLLQDIDFLRNIVLQNLEKDKKSQQPNEKLMDIDAFLDAINREKNSGDKSSTS